jgi:hypothetical protein
VGFVHNQGGDGGLGEGAHEGGVAESLRRDVEKLQPAGAQLVEACLLFGDGDRAVEEGGGEAAGGEGVDLVLHQGDEG